MILFLMFAIASHAFSVTTADSQIPEMLEFIVTNRNEIWHVEENGNKYRYFTNTTAIGDIDYHLEKNLLFWIDTERHEIHSQSLDVNVTSPRMIFTQQKTWEPVAVAVDFIGDKVYVADVVGMKVDVFELDGRYHTVAMGSDLVQPIDIKLDPYERYMFILDGFRILRASMDGSSAITIIPQGIRIMHGCAIDPVAKKIYWSRDTDFQIVSADYSGENVTSLDKNNTSYLIWTKFAALNGSIFWASNYVQFKSQCCPEKLGTRRKTIYQSNPVPTIKAIHSSLQKPEPNPCGNNNGECQHMCILTSSNDKIGDSYRCACSAGWILADNLKSCTRVKDFLIYAQSKIMRSHLIDNCTGVSCEPYLPFSGDKIKYRDFYYDYTDNYLYYSVREGLKYDKLYKIHPNESTPEIVLNTDNYQSIAIDVFTKNLYFIDGTEDTINVVNSRNRSEKKLLLNKLNRPEEIVLHPDKGFMYFLQTNDSSKITVLSRARVDGSDLTVFNNISLQEPCGFTVDLYDDRVYWFNFSKTFVQHGNLDMYDVKTIRTDLTSHLYAIAVYKKWLYAATILSGGLWRFDKETGERAELIFPDFANRITKVKAFSTEPREMNRNHPCIVDNGGCTEFCFGLPQSSNNTWTKICADSDKKVQKLNDKCT